MLKLFEGSTFPKKPLGFATKLRQRVQVTHTPVETLQTFEVEPSTGVQVVNTPPETLEVEPPPKVRKPSKFVSNVRNATGSLEDPTRTDIRRGRGTIPLLTRQLAALKAADDDLYVSDTKPVQHKPKSRTMLMLPSL
jgi:hypothetical protein